MAPWFNRFPAEIHSLILDNLNPGDILRLLKHGIVSLGVLTRHHVSMQDGAGDTILHLVSVEDWNIQEELMAAVISRSRDFSIPNRQGLTALHSAILRVNYTAVRLLIDAGAQVPNEECHFAGRTLLSDAVVAGDLEMVELLLDGGARTDAADTYDMQPLHHAASKGDLDAIQLLIDRGADLEAISMIGTPLHEAADPGHADAVKLLLRNGADPSAVNEHNGWTATWLAASEGRPDVAKLLVDAGARDDILLADSDGITPLHLAAAGGQARYHEAYNAAVHHGQNFRSFLGASVVPDEDIPRYNAVLQIFINSGIDVDSSDEEGDTALHLAAAFGNVVAVGQLLRAGADVTRRTHTGRSALAIAYSRGHQNVCHHLNQGRNLPSGLAFSFDAPGMDHLEIHQLRNIVCCQGLLALVVHC